MTTAVLEGFQLVPSASTACRTLGLAAIIPLWSPNWLFWGVPDQLGLITADDAIDECLLAEGRKDRPKGRTKT
jgi:hypothetical protein